MIRLGAGRVASFALAVAAIVLVATMVPIRDRCWDPASAASTRTAVTRDASGCVLHVPSGAVTISAAACARLHCEPGLTTALARAKPDVLAALFFLYLIGTLAWAARWRALLGFAGVDLSVLQVWRISIEAQAGGVLLPGGIGGDALRIAYVVSRPPRSECRRHGCAWSAT